MYKKYAFAFKVVADQRTQDPMSTIQAKDKQRYYTAYSFERYL